MKRLATSVGLAVLLFPWLSSCSAPEEWLLERTTLVSGPTHEVSFVPGTDLLLLVQAILQDGTAVASEVRAVSMETSSVLWERSYSPHAHITVDTSGEIAAIGGADGTLSFVSARTGAEMDALQFSDAGVTALEFAPGRRAVAVGFRDGRLAAVDVDASAVLWRRRLFGGGVTAVLWDEARLYVAGCESTSPCGVAAIAAIELATGIPIWEIEGHTGSVFDLAVIPEGDVLVTASMDRSLGVWNTATGAHAGYLAGHDGAVYAVAYVEPTNQVISAGWRGRVHVRSGTSSDYVELRGSDIMSDIAVSSSGELIAIAGYAGLYWMRPVDQSR